MSDANTVPALGRMVRSPDDPDVVVLATILVERYGQGRANDLGRHIEARRMLWVMREFMNRTGIGQPVIGNCPECDEPLGANQPNCAHWPNG